MTTTIVTSTSNTATAYPNQRKVDRCQNGVLWAMFWDGTSTTTRRQCGSAITAPTSGGTVSANPTAVTWSAYGQVA